MADQKKAKYFCESCGSEVGAKARFCPKCGKFFAAVRCPKCGKTGTVNDFKKGCPKCHYAMTHEDIYGSPDEDTEVDGTKKKKLSFKSKRRIKKAFSKHESGSEEIPLWLLIASLVVLIFVCILVIGRCS